ncbi:MAG: hypothetical protein ISR64_10965 [Deltaproteobacteria bacterium]|nr:hypothetical protein [Deltaproteobacteria bacterium]
MINSSGPGAGGDTLLVHPELPEGIYYVEVVSVDGEEQLSQYTITLTATDPSSPD